MTSLRKLEANRRNATKSTGPQTEAGKRRSRRNAMRHGLTAETVIDGLEDSKDYQSFQQSVTAEFEAQTAVERELVLRLANLLWRLRRAIAIETGLFETQANRKSCAEEAELRAGQARAIILAPTTTSETGLNGLKPAGLYVDAASCNGGHGPGLPAPNAFIALCFQRLSDLDHGAFARLNRYETALWRQACQVLIMLGILRRHELHGAGCSRRGRGEQFPSPRPPRW
jgi:hypothetical protein